MMDYEANGLKKFPIDAYDIRPSSRRDDCHRRQAKHGQDSLRDERCRTRCSTRWQSSRHLQPGNEQPATSLNFSQVFKFVRTKYVHNIHRRRYVMTSFTLDPLHSEISWVRGLFSELPRFFGDRSDLFAPQRQSSCTLTRSREPTL